MKKFENLRFTLAQIEIISGDLKGNYDKVKNIILDNFKTDKTDVIVFPETTISGYNIGLLFENDEFILEQMNLIDSLIPLIPYNKMVVIGYVRMTGIKKNGKLKLYNSVAIINEGKLNFYDKQLLAYGDHHDDNHYLKSGKVSKIFNLKVNDIEFKGGFPICEDIFYKDHDRNICKEMVDQGAEILIACNQSYFYPLKNFIREDLLHNITKELNVPMIYVNSCSIGDILKNFFIYDGGSLIFDNNGNIMYKLPQFEEIITTYRLTNLNPSYYDNLLPADKNYEYKQLFNALKFGTKKIFEACGIKKCSVHISGGIDSALVAAIVKETFNKEDIVFITNPSSLSSDSLVIAKELCENLDIKLYIEPIQEVFEQILKLHKDTFGIELNLVGQSSVQAVLRKVLGLAATHTFSSGIINCGNHTENTCNWFSFNDIGSNGGICQIIGDLTKTEIFELSKWINDVYYKKEIIPSQIYNGKVVPKAELPDAIDDNIDYYVQSAICSEIVRNNKTLKKLLFEYEHKCLDKNVFEDLNGKQIYELYTLEEFKKEIKFAIKQRKRSVYKLAQSSPILILSSKSRGFSSRETIINKSEY